MFVDQNDLCVAPSVKGHGLVQCCLRGESFTELARCPHRITPMRGELSSPPLTFDNFVT